MSVPIMRLIMKLATSKRVRSRGGSCCRSASTSSELVVVRLGAAGSCCWCAATPLEPAVGPVATLECGVMSLVGLGSGVDASDMANREKQDMCTGGEKLAEKVRMVKKQQTESEEERCGRGKIVERL